MLQANGRTGLLFGRALKVARQVAAAGAECAVCELIIVGAGVQQCGRVSLRAGSWFAGLRRQRLWRQLLRRLAHSRLYQPAARTVYATPSRVVAVLRFFTVIKHILHYRCLTAPCPGLPACAGTRKVKPIWILLKQETVSGSGIS